MIAKLIFFDKGLTLFIKDLLPHNQFFNLFFSFFSLQGLTIFLWITIFILVIILEERKNPGISYRDKKFIIYFLISFLTTAFIVNFVAKNFIQRPRPMITNSTCPSDFSFPSGHSSLSFAAAAIISAFDKKRKKLYYFVATLIAFSRIYLGCHYFFDVFFGAIIGYLIAKLTLKLNLKV